MGEHREFFAMVARQIRAGGRRIADADEVDLLELVELHAEVEKALQVAVDGQRASGSSWAQIARGLGITRQAAQMRWGKAVAS